MCVTSMQMTRVSRAYYCMEDPRLRDPGTRESRARVGQFYGRLLEAEPLEDAICRFAGEALWAFAQPRRVAQNLQESGERLLQPAYAELRSMTVAHPANIELLERLRRMTGEPLAWESLEEAAARGEYVEMRGPLGTTRPNPALDAAAARVQQGYLKLIEQLRFLSGQYTEEGGLPTLADEIPALAAAHRRSMREALDLPEPPVDVREAEEEALKRRLPRQREPDLLGPTEFQHLLQRMSREEMNHYLALPFEEQNAYLNRLAIEKRIIPPGRR